ncbi:PspC domain-containing protein [Micromonospora sp. WMMD812]|uniref:PspC domain-containing protein n=1 Tax=Micromonospora sp. WMMD812 TaxID=3015152 RepID=UPI00248BC0FF|nr:PspC domain-containing protein [Micromonospora sp. WMMD812]WBB66475.1 PspC domain-containing protein [Micromonospora sp. WMMD812]
MTEEAAPPPRPQAGQPGEPSPPPPAASTDRTGPATFGPPAPSGPHPAGAEEPTRAGLAAASEPVAHTGWETGGGLGAGPAAYGPGPDATARGGSAGVSGPTGASGAGFGAPGGAGFGGPGGAGVGAPGGAGVGAPGGAGVGAPGGAGVGAPGGAGVGGPGGAGVGFGGPGGAGFGAGAPGGAGGTPPPFGVPPGATAGPPPGAAGFTSRYGLVRPREGRYLAGVCAAIGRATNTDPVLWRVLLAVLGFFGGIGILVYVTAWLIIPGEGDTASPVESMLGRGRSSMSPVTVIVLSILVAVSFGYIVTDAFRAVLLGAAILIGGALLLNRNSRADQPAPPPGPTPAAAPPGPVPPVSYPAPDRYAAPPTADLSAAAGAPAPGVGPTSALPPVGGHPVSAPHGGSAAYGGTPVSGGAPVPGPAPVSGQPAEPTAEMPTWSPAGATAERPSTHATTSSWPLAPGEAVASGAPAGASYPPTAPLPPAGYRPPFAPHGPYASQSAGYPPARPPKPAKPPKRPKERSPLGAVTFSLIFLALGVVAVLDLLNVFDVGASAYFAAALATIGLGLVVGTWFGRARWLIALGLVTAAALAVGTVAESYDRVRGVDGAVTWAPASYQDLALRYENSFGDAVLDLRAVDFDKKNTEVTVSINFGQGTVVVPPNVDVTTVADVNAGDATIFGRHYAGPAGRSREITDLGPDGAGGGTLRLFIHVNAGNLEVTR